MFNSFQIIDDARGNFTLDFDTQYQIRITTGHTYTLPKAAPETRGRKIALLMLNPTDPSFPTLAFAPGDTYAYTDGAANWASVPGLLLWSDGEGHWWPWTFETLQAG